MSDRDLTAITVDLFADHLAALLDTTAELVASLITAIDDCDADRADQEGEAA